MIRKVDDRGWLLDTKLEVFRKFRAVSAAAGTSQTGDAAAPAVAPTGEWRPHNDFPITDQDRLIPGERFDED